MALATPDIAEALGWIAQLADHAARHGVLAVRGAQSHVTDGEAMLHHELKHALAATSTGSESRIEDREVLSWRAIIQLGVGSTLAQLGRFEDARIVLEEARGTTGALPSRSLLHATLLMQADVAAQIGEPGALDVLAAALRLGRELGSSDLGLLNRQRLAVLSACALEKGIEAEYVRSLIRIHKLTPPPSAGASWPYQLHIRALGGFDLLVDEKPVVPGGKAQVVPLRMLETLVALGGRSVEKSRLSDVLWPDAAGDTAAQAFDTTLHRLRRLLGNPRTLVLFDGKLSLAPDLVWIDSWAIEPLLTALNQARITVAERVAKAGHMIDLYRGPLHAGSEQPIWVTPRTRLHERVVRAITRAAESAESSGELEGARTLFAAGTAIDPTVEAFYQGEIRCAARAGQKAEVARIYKRCQQVLRASLGVEPSEATRDIAFRETT
jgi:DNA-binding SARP family transcriptional activator